MYPTASAAASHQFIWILDCDSHITVTENRVSVFNELTETLFFSTSHILKASLKQRCTLEQGVRRLLLAHSPLSLQVGEPAQVIGDDMVVPAAGTCHDHHPSVVGGLRDGFR